MPWPLALQMMQRPDPGHGTETDLMASATGERPVATTCSLVHRRGALKRNWQLISVDINTKVVKLFEIYDVGTLEFWMFVLLGNSGEG